MLYKPKRRNFMKKRKLRSSQKRSSFLRKMMTKYRITDTELSILIGVDKSILYQWMSSMKDIDESYIDEIVSIFNEYGACVNSNDFIIPKY